MRTVMVRYKVKSERVEENRKYIEKVFEELKRSAPEGFRYGSFLAEDGRSFVHMASIDTANGENPLSKIPAFQAFVANIRDRCDDPPVAVDLSPVGNYRFLGG